MSTGPDALARLLFLHATEKNNGVLLVGAAGGQVARVTLSDGWVHALGNVGPRGGRGEEMLEALLGRLRSDAVVRFEQGARDTWGRVTPFHPARMVRRHFDRRRGASKSRAEEERFVLRLRPHASCLEGDEAVVAALLEVERSFAELCRVSPALRGIYRNDR